MNYGNQAQGANTISTGLAAQIQPARQGEVSGLMETIDKQLHELHEEASGLNGTFLTVLAAHGPESAGASSPSAPNATGLGDALQGFSARLRTTIATLRDIRSRCEL